MATNVIEILLKLRKEGGEVLEQVSDSISNIKKAMESDSSHFFDSLGAELKSAGAEAKKVDNAMRDLKKATQDPLSKEYVSGFLEALKSTDKAALEAQLSVKKVKDELASGGSKSAAILGMVDALGMTSKEAEKAKQRLQELNGVNLSPLKTSLTEVTTAVQGIGGKFNLEGLKNALNGAQSGVTGLLTSVRGLVGIFAGFTAVNYLKDAANSAARTEVLGTVLKQVGQNAGYTSTELDKADKAVQKMGITASSSRESLVALINAGLKIDLAAPLARAAQDLAVIAGWNSSDTFQRLITNISQLDTMGLRFMGIMVDRTRAEQQYAAALGKSADALSAKEQKEAFANAVLEEAAKRQGIYEASMTNVAKQTQSLARYKENLAVAIGEKLLPAYLEVVKLMTYFLKESEQTASSLDKNQESAKGFGEALGVVFQLVREGTDLLKEHKDLIIGVAAAWAGFKVVGLLAGLIQIGGTLSFVGTAAVAAFGLIETGLIAIMTSVAGLGPIFGTAAGAIIARAGAVGAAIWAVWKIVELGKAIWEFGEAKKSLRELQESAAEATKKLPESFKAAVEKFKTSSADLTSTTGKTKDQIRAQMEEMTKGIEYAGKKYTEALLAGKNATAEQKKAIEDWDNVVQKQMIPALERMSKAMAEAKDAEIDLNVAAYQSKVEQINMLTLSYKTVVEAVKDYQKAVSSATDEVYKMANAGLSAKYKEEQALLQATEVYQGQNRQKMLANDMAYYANSLALAKEEFDAKKKLAEANYESQAALLAGLIRLNEKDNPEQAKAQTAELLQMRKNFTEQSLQLAQQEHSRIVALRDQAFQKYTDQLKQVAQLEKELAQENMDHEVKVHDLKVRLGEDTLKSREEAIRDRERALSDRERVAQASGDKSAMEAIRREREGLSRDRDQITRDRESMQKAIEADAKNQFDVYIAKAKEELAKGGEANTKLAAEYEKIAQHYAGSATTVAEKLREENALHDVKVQRLGQEQEVAKASAESQRLAFETLTSAMEVSGNQISVLISKLAELGYESQLVTLKLKFSQLSGEIESTVNELDKLKSRPVALPGDAAKIEELTRNLARLRAESGVVGGSVEKLKGSLDDLVKNRKELEIKTDTAQRAMDGLRRDKEHLDEVLKRPNAVKVEAKMDTALKGTLDFKRELDSVTDKPRTVTVRSDIAPASEALKYVVSQIELVKAKLESQKKLGLDTTEAEKQMALLQSQYKALTEDTTSNPIKPNVITQEAITKLMGLGFSAEEARKALENPMSISITRRGPDEVGALKEQIIDVQKNGTVNITANTGEAQAGVGEVRRELDSLTGAPAIVTVTADSVAAEAELTKIDNENPDVKATVTADSTEAEMTIDQLSNQSPAIRAEVEADTSPADRAVSQFERQTPNVHGRVDADNSAAMAAINAIPRSITTYHYIKTIQSNALGGLMDDGWVQHFADGGYNRFAGLVSGPGTGTSDSIPALIANGEFIMRTAAVSHYGADLFHALNQMAMPNPVRFAGGGMVLDGVSGRLPSFMTTSPSANESMDGGKRDTVDVNLNIGGQVHRLESSRDTAKRLASSLRELQRAG